MERDHRLETHALSLDPNQKFLIGGGYSSAIQHTEVAEAASELLLKAMGSADHAARSSVGARQLPKGVTVELFLVAGLWDAQA